MILKNLNMRLLSLNWNNPPCLNSFHIILYWLMFSATCLLLVNGDQHKIDNYTSVKCPDKICKGLFFGFVFYPVFYVLISKYRFVC